MGRLIDADKLKQHYSWWGGLIGDDYVSELVEQKKVFDTIIDVQPTVEQPQTNATENMVEIVRCKDCKFYWKNDRNSKGVVCLATPKDDAFCSEGERKEDE